MFQTTTYAQAKQDGEITQEFLVYPQESVLVKASGIKKLNNVANNAIKGGGQGNKILENKVLEHKIQNNTTTENATTNQPYADTKMLGKNPNFADIFGNIHYFFRPYTHETLECKVRTLPHAYAYTNDESVWTKSKKALISYSSFRHPLDPTTQSKDLYRGKLAALNFRLSRLKKWLKFYKDALFCKQKECSIAILHRCTEDGYGHFIRDVMGGFYQLKLANITPDFYVLPLNTPFQAQMYELLKIPKERIIPTSSKQLLHAKELIIHTPISDYEIIEYRQYMHFRSFILPLYIYDMYESLFPNLAQIPAEKKLFLTRPAASNRNIENLHEVEEIFESFGYEIILPDALSLKEQMQLFASAKIIASMHGSGLNNALFAKKGIKVLEIFSQYYHDCNPQFTLLARQCDYHYIVGQTRDISMHPQQENVYLPPHKLKRALQILESTPESM